MDINCLKSVNAIDLIDGGTLVDFDGPGKIVITIDDILDVCDEHADHECITDGEFFVSLLDIDEFNERLEVKASAKN